MNCVFGGVFVFLLLGGFVGMRQQWGKSARSAEMPDGGCRIRGVSVLGQKVCDPFWPGFRRDRA